MKKMYTAVLALSLLASGAAFAQDHDRDGRDSRNNSAQHDDRNQDRGQQQARHDGGDDRRDRGRVEGRNDRVQYAQHDNGGPRGAGPRHDMRKGQRVPSDYRGNQYVVEDYRAHHLNKPPRGMHWVQAGNDYVLVAVATGIIAQVLLNQ
jgi:Ni/Co efflux regulator RcnB